MRIQHNIMAMNAYRNYSNNVSAMKANLEKLSSGYKINRAGDDAAGLAISEKMRAQITGLETAQKNAKDGISLVQTAEGALTEVHDMLNRMVELASQSANGTYDNETDRAQMQKEIEQLKEEIDRIADSSNFNGINLLDGSMDASADITKKVNFTVGSGVLPDVGTILGTNTVLHNDTANTGTGGTTFHIDLHNTTFANGSDDEMVLTVGDAEIAIKGDGTGSLTGADLADKIVAETGGTVTIKGQEFTVASVADGSDGDVRLEFTQKKAPTMSSEVVDGAMKVNITGVTGPTASDDGPHVSGSLPSSLTLATDIAGDFSGLDTAALGKAASELSTPPSQGDDITIKWDNTSKKFQLLAGSTVIGVSGDQTSMSIAASDSGSIEFFAADDTGAATSVSVGSITISNGSSAAFDATAANTALGTAKALDTGKVTYDDGEPATMTGPSAFTITTTPGTASTAATASLDLDTLDLDKPGTLTFTIGGKTFDLEVTEADLAATTPAEEIAAKLATMLNGKFDDGVGGKFTAEVDSGTATQINFTASTIGEGTDAAPLGNAFDVKVATSSSTGTSSVADYNVSTTDITNVGLDSASSRLASTYFTLDKGMVENGSKLRIGDTTYTFTTNEANKDAANYVYVGDLNSTDSSYMTKVAERLTKAAAGNSTWTVGHDGDRMTFTENTKGGSHADYEDLKTSAGIAKSFEFIGAQKMGKGLTLQIGDTADSYNKLNVNIGDMHADALGIGSIDVGTQEGATAALDAIKAAINKVSDVRGTLGATQNRLDHTINNLSVMTENIQDAESTIRDTDVAEEMMAYTKNNILIQSAQAMLAQANQVPQGVLQLLQ